MKSALSRCTVVHARHTPAKHAFRYPFYTYAINLDELETLHQTLPYFSYNSFNITSIYDKDYLNRGEGSIKEKLLAILEQNEIPEVKDIYLITQFKYFGYVFNPVSFYYCYSSKSVSAEPRAVLCEVNNTFNERHLYVLDNKEGNQTPLKLTAEKKFHVSPFNNRKGLYHFTFGNIKKELDVSIALEREGGKMFFARIYGSLDKLTAKNHISTILKLPFIPLVTIPRIFYEAARLFFLRKLKYVPKPVAESRMTIRKIKPNAIDKFCFSIMKDMFQKIKRGHLTLIQPEGEVLEFGDKRTGQTAKMIVNEWPFYTRLVMDGDIGFGEGYVNNQMESPDIAALGILFIDNNEIFNGGNFASSILTQFVEYFRYLHHRNSMTGSKKNISMHYDLSNRFFSLFLDTTMMYSSGMFKSPGDSLRKSQLNKIHTIIEKLKVTKTDHILEIGCGWGGFAIEAVKKTGCRVTGVTISQQQYDFAIAAIEKAGLGKNITIELKDYRDIEGTFDKIVSIEMAEAVGARYLGKYFNKIDSLLGRDGLALLQIITIPDNRHDAYKRQSDWIKKHIFNGGHLPSLTEISSNLKKHTQFHIHHLENIGTDYAKTLGLWKANFEKNLERVMKLGFDEEFIRKWRYYLAICEAGFEARILNDIQILLTRENNYLL
jgi:cyclopropane-fatty-acyl-phospholipid synthase